MFQGFTEETFGFFAAISMNNSTEFFHENHDWYMEHVRKPCLDLAMALSPAVERFDDSLERNPKRVIGRINRDMRYARNLPMYKDYMYLSFKSADGGEFPRMGAYFDIGFQYANYGYGLYGANKPLAKALRLDLERDSTEFLSAWLPVRGEFALMGERAKRLSIPEGLHEEAARWYALDGFYVEKRLKDFALLKSAALVDEISAGLARLTPLCRYFQRLQSAVSV